MRVVIVEIEALGTLDFEFKFVFRLLSDISECLCGHFAHERLFFQKVSIHITQTHRTQFYVCRVLYQKAVCRHLELLKVCVVILGVNPRPEAFNVFVCTGRSERIVHNIFENIRYITVIEKSIFVCIS